MKNYLVLYLFAICIAEITGCSPATKRDPIAWKKEYDNRHPANIHAIVYGVIDRVKNYADDVGTMAANNCYEDSLLELRGLSTDGEQKVKRCIDVADSKQQGEECCYKVASSVGEEATRLGMTTTRCIDNS